MIISSTLGFVFLHNPKTAGTSLRDALSPYHDWHETYWGRRPGPDGRVIDAAHLGIDELAAFRPHDWDRLRGLEFWSVRREPVSRLLSAVSEYGKWADDRKVKWLPAADRRAFVFSVLDELSAYGDAENLLVSADAHLAHFKPQWIYWSSSNPSVSVRSWSTEDLGQMLSALGALTGGSLALPARNVTEVPLNTPKVLGPLLASRRWGRAFRRVPGRERLVRSLAKTDSSMTMSERHGLTESDLETIEEFVRVFYAKDLARWPE